MKTVQRFQAEDGCLFETAEQAHERDVLVDRLRWIQRALGLRVERDGDRKTHKLERVAEFKRELIGICRERFPGEMAFVGDPQKIHPMSYAGRLIDDAGPDVLREAWFRLASIAEDGTEYSQPFFAMNPDKWEER